LKPLKGNRNQCGACGEYFNSVKPFEIHRIGKHGVNRRCMTREEMLARGMSLNKEGFWISSKMPESLRSHHERNDVEEG
jgi:hypothetical protein